MVNNTESLEVRNEFLFQTRTVIFQRERSAPQTAYRSSIPETFYMFIARVDVENDRNLLICKAHHTIRVLCHIVLVENAIASWNKGLAVTIRHNV